MLNNLNEFGYMCFAGELKDALAVRYHVFRGTSSGEAHCILQLLTAQRNRPDLTWKQRPTGNSYVQLVVLGYIGRVPLGDCNPDDYIKLLDVLLSAGVPVDSSNILGMTALHRVARWPGTQDLIEVLLKHKANVNQQDRFGASPLLIAIEKDIVDAISMFLDAGASLDATDGEGSSPRSVYPTCSAEVSGVVRSWVVKHEGKGSVLQGDRCSKCGTRTVSVKRCARCRSQLYCSPECQSEFIRTNTILSHTPHNIQSIEGLDWKEHKKSCQPFDKEDNLLIVTPSYTHGGYSDMSTVNEMFKANVRNGRNMVLRIWEIPVTGNGGMIVCNKKRSFECLLEYGKNPVAYARIKKVINEKGIGGMRAYFAAELRSKDELAINIAECLPESRF